MSTIQPVPGTTADPALKSELDAVVAHARSDAERRDSEAIYNALARSKGELGAAGDLPKDLTKLSESIHTQAMKRSAELRASQGLPQPTSQADKPIPWWLVAAWIVGIAAVAAAFWWSNSSG